MAKQVGATVSPVGIAFELAKTKRPGFELYGEDKFHPSVAGSYLIACVHFACVYGKSPVGLPERLYSSVDKKTKPLVELDKDTAAFLQGVAWEAIETGQQLAKQQ